METFLRISGGTAFAGVLSLFSALCMRATGEAFRRKGAPDIFGYGQLGTVFFWLGLGLLVLGLTGLAVAGIIVLVT